VAPITREIRRPQKPHEREVGYPSLCPAQLGTPSLRMFQYQTISFTGLQSVLLRHRGDDTVHPQVLYKLPVVVCDVPNGND